MTPLSGAAAVQGPRELRAPERGQQQVGAGDAGVQRARHPALRLPRLPGPRAGRRSRPRAAGGAPLPTAPSVLHSWL